MCVCARVSLSPAKCLFYKSCKINERKWKLSLESVCVVIRGVFLLDSLLGCIINYILYAYNWCQSSIVTISETL